MPHVSTTENETGMWQHVFKVMSPVIADPINAARAATASALDKASNNMVNDDEGFDYMIES